jgi:hypothetical protein
MAETPRYPVRLSDSDRKMLAEIAEHHDRKAADMIRYLIRAEHSRMRRVKTFPAPPSAPEADDLPFDIVEE